MHVLSANAVVAVALHRVIGDKLMAEIVYQLTQAYTKLEIEVEDQQEIEEIGYSKIHERKKNYITIISLFYEFAAISGSFPQSLVFYLAKGVSLVNKKNIELIYQVVQKCGVRMRSHDPATLKDVIEVLKNMIEESKKNGLY